LTHVCGLAYTTPEEGNPSCRFSPVLRDHKPFGLGSPSFEGPDDGRHPGEITGMNMSTLILISVVVAVILLFFAYRQTIGAKMIRVRLANEDLETILMKRVVLEGYQPSAEGLTRIISGKAREYNLKRSDMMTESQLLDVIFTKVIESDLITQELRSDLIKRLSPMLKIVEAEQVKELSLGSKS